MQNGYVEPRLAGLHVVECECSAALKAATVGPDAVRLSSAAAGDLSGRIRRVELRSPCVVRITFDGPLPDGETYTLVLTDELRDGGGRPLCGETSLRARARCGDVNGDGVVTSADILRVREAAGRALVPRCDIDRSGTVTGTDMLAVRRRLTEAAP